MRPHRVDIWDYEPSKLFGTDLFVYLMVCEHEWPDIAMLGKRVGLTSVGIALHLKRLLEEYPELPHRELVLDALERYGQLAEEGPVL